MRRLQAAGKDAADLASGVSRAGAAATSRAAAAAATSRAAAAASTSGAAAAATTPICSSGGRLTSTADRTAGKLPYTNTVKTEAGAWWSVDTQVYIESCLLPCPPGPPHSQGCQVGHRRQRLAGDTASATSARVPCCGWPSLAGAMLPMRFMQVAVFQATHVSSCVVLRLALSAAMRRAAHDRMSSLQAEGAGRRGGKGACLSAGAQGV